MGGDIITFFRLSLDWMQLVTEKNSIFLDEIKTYHARSHKFIEVGYFRIMLRCFFVCCAMAIIFRPTKRKEREKKEKKNGGELLLLTDIVRLFFVSHP